MCVFHADMGHTSGRGIVRCIGLVEDEGDEDGHKIQFRFAHYLSVYFDHMSASGGGDHSPSSLPASGGGRRKEVTSSTQEKYEEEPIVEAYSVPEGTGVVAASPIPEEGIIEDGRKGRGPRRKWAHGFCDICYVDKDHNNTFFPYCCPYSYPCSCIMTGKLVALYGDEQAICCEMDSNGTLCAILGCASSYFVPYLWCCIHAMFYRQDVIYKYNVETEDPVCCVCFDVLYRGVFFPCAYLQMYNSIKIWKGEETTALIPARSVDKKSNDKSQQETT